MPFVRSHAVTVLRRTRTALRVPNVRPARRHARAVARVMLASACTAALACSPDAALVPRPADATAVRAARVPGMDAPAPTGFATYDGSDEVVHPDVVAFSTPWNGHRYWTAITPYPNGNWRVENPSLFASGNGETFTVPSGLTNPIAQTRRGHLSDPDMLYNAATKELWMYYREVVKSGRRHVGDRVFLTRSGDGVRWSAPAPVVAATKHYVVSPTVARDAATGWRMWAVDAGKGGCDARTTKIVTRRSTDGIHWTESSPVSFTQPGYWPWHLDVQYLPERREFWALVAAYPDGEGCTGTELFLATSPDGDSWTTYPSPVLARGALAQFAANVYRSTFHYDPADQSVMLWFSGARITGPRVGRAPATMRWSAAVARTTAAALLERVSAPSAAGRGPAASRTRASALRCESLHSCEASDMMP